MHKTLPVLSSVLLVGCAATGSDVPATASSFQPGAAAATAASLTHIEDVDVHAAARDDGYVCVEEARTGTRIARKRCYFRDAEAEQQRQEQARAFIDDLSRQQMFEEIARQQAREQEFRRMMEMARQR